MDRTQIQKSEDSKRWIVLLIQFHLLISLIACGLLYANDPFGFLVPIEVLFQITCKFFLAFVIWFFLSWYLITKRVIDPYTIFLTSAILFNGGQVILEIFHMNRDGFLKDLFSPEQSLFIVYFALLGLFSMHFGAILSVIFASNKTSLKVLNDNLSNKIPIHILFKVGQILLYISIIPTLVIIADTIRVFLSEGYAALYQQAQITGVAASASLIASLIFPGAFFVIAGGQGKPYSRRFAVVFILFYTCSRFFVGSRGAAIMPLLSMLWLWNMTVKPLPKVLFLIVALLMLVVVFPLVGAIRNSQSELSIEFLIKSLSDIDNPLIASISEMGGSLTTVGWTMQLVPNVRPFALGMTYLVGILVLIPNVFAQGRHPALTFSGFDIPDFWLVQEIDPLFADRGGSFGFSFIAEAYLNFGWAGIFVLGGIGFLYGKAIVWAMQDKDPAKMAVMAVFVSFFLFYARGGSEMVFRPFIWYSLIPYLCAKYFSLQKKQST